MKILNKLPIHDKPAVLPVPVGSLIALPGQIILRASLTPEDVDQLSGFEPTFPVVVDTGNTFTFAIRKRQLDLWLSHVFQEIGDIKVSGVVVPRYEAKLWIHPNIKGGHSLSGARPVPLE